MILRSFASALVCLVGLGLAPSAVHAEPPPREYLPGLPGSQGPGLDTLYRSVRRNNDRANTNEPARSNSPQRLEPLLPEPISIPSPQTSRTRERSAEEQRPDNSNRPGTESTRSTRPDQNRQTESRPRSSDNNARPESNPTTQSQNAGQEQSQGNTNPRDRQPPANASRESRTMPEQNTPRVDSPAARTGEQASPRTNRETGATVAGRAADVRVGRTVASAMSIRPSSGTRSRELQESGNAIPGLPSDLSPTPIGIYRYRAPDYYQGIYLTSHTARTPRVYEPLLANAKRHGINVLVVDVQPRAPSLEFMRHARESGFYLVSRVVVFEGGLKTFPPPMDHINRVMDAAENSVEIGFMEVQLDYIRFSDHWRGQRLSLETRYRVITGVLKHATERLRPHGVRIGADIFGRIPFNRNDHIGQQLELFAEHLDTIYPMLYPSHFYGQPNRIADPYRTIRDGAKISIDRVANTARIINYIQGFRMSIGPSGLSYTNYIREQIKAAEDSGSAGYIVWNARNRYEPFFTALAAHNRANQNGTSTESGGTAR